MAAAAARRALQNQAWPLQTLVSAIPAELIGSDVRLKVPVVSRAPVDWQLLQDRRCSYGLTPLKAWNYATVRGYYMRNISQLVATANNKRAFLVDTLALVRRLEAQGLTPKQAEAITAVITEVLNDSLENVAQSFTSKTEMTRSEMMAEAALSKFKGEVQSSQEHHFATLQRETERLRTDIDKMRSELRYEIDKVTAGQRLDLNLERGRIREELATQSSETSNLTNKLDREIHTLKTQLEAAKYDVIKYCIGTVPLSLLRLLGLVSCAFSSEASIYNSIGHRCWRREQGEIRRVPHLPDLCKCSCVRLFMLSAVDRKYHSTILGSIFFCHCIQASWRQFILSGHSSTGRYCPLTCNVR